MKKQFHKIKIAAENLSRSNKLDNKNDELNKVEKQVDKYKDVLDKIHKKFSPSAGTDQDRDKRIKKVNEYRLAQTLDETLKDLPEELCLFNVLKKCGELERNIANHIIDYEIQTENDVTKRLKAILDNDIQQISNHKRTVNRFVAEYNSVKKAHENAQRSNETQKITSLRQEQEELELKLEKERDCLAAEMFALLAKDEDMANCVKDFVECQKTYYERILENIEQNLKDINSVVKKCDKKRIFGVPLNEHLSSSNRKISKVIELSACCLIERGLNEEGLLRVGCAGTKLRRLKNALDAQYVNTPLATEYQDIHVIAGLLKLYLRELPEPLLTYKLYTDFIHAAQRPTEAERKSAILNAVNDLRTTNPGHYENLRYLMRFLWCLWQRQEVNKMSSQNIAIVMSPNILWPPESSTNPNDYAGQVNSSAAVNTITELLVSEWDYFFDGDVEFYQTITRDNLFAETASEATGGFIAAEKENAPFLTEAITQQQSSHRTHSRSSSHDTSRILFSSDTVSMTRGHSNDSLSDTSSPTHADSPKLPHRRRHNKPSAPTPPHKVNPNQNHSNILPESKLSAQNVMNQIVSEGSGVSAVSQASVKCDGFSQTPPITTKSEQGQNTAKPDKPPRPAPIECATLNRSTYKNRDKTLFNKPVALPRTILNAAKSSENLTTTPEDEKIEIREKPAIPERPATLVRPISFRNDQFQEMMNKVSSSETSSAPPTGTSLKKASSFRGMSSNSMSNSQQQGTGRTQTPTSNGNSNGCANNNGNSALNTTSHNNNHKTTLERAQIYSVDKQQVSIINVTSSEPATLTTSVTTTASKSPLRVENPATIADNAMTQSKEFLANESGMQISITQVPPSPRGFDPRIKRPQVPAPPPPTNHRRSDGTLGDTTHL